MLYPIGLNGLIYQGYAKDLGHLLYKCAQEIFETNPY